MIFSYVYAIFFFFTCVGALITLSIKKITSKKTSTTSDYSLAYHHQGGRLNLTGQASCKVGSFTLHHFSNKLKLLAE